MERKVQMNTNSRHNTPTSTGEGDPAPTVKQIKLRSRVSVLEEEDAPPPPPPSSPQHSLRAVLPPPLPTSEPKAAPAPALEKRTSDPDFVAAASKIAAADDKPPASDRRSPWVEVAPAEVVDVPKQLPDAGPDGPSQVTVVSRQAPPAQKPKDKSPPPPKKSFGFKLNPEIKRAAIGILGVIIAVAIGLLVAPSLFFVKKQPVTITAETPSQTGVAGSTPITAGTLNAFTNGTQSDPANFTPFENPALVIACQKPPSPGKKKGFDIRSCLIFKK